MSYCGVCSEEFSPVEYQTDNGEDPVFCSWECEDVHAENENYKEIYELGRYGGAPGI